MQEDCVHRPFLVRKRFRVGDNFTVFAYICCFWEERNDNGSRKYIATWFHFSFYSDFELNKNIEQS